MTGFGSAEGVVAGGRVVVELRSVNHRFFSPAIKLPGPLARWELEVREALRKVITRGHVTVSARLDRSAIPAVSVIDEERFTNWVARLRDLRDRHGLEGAIDIATVLRMPDVLASPSEEEQGTAAELVEIVSNAAEALNRSRETEGARLAAFLGERLSCIEEAVERLAVRAPQRLESHRERLRSNIAEVAGGMQVDEQRLLQELAIVADRWDVGEELDRFRAHLAAFRETLRTGAPEGVGKRLGFLLQELLREANTTGSKSNDVAMTRDVVAIKEELERIREQVENLE